jgi:REP element-mobilizing transposase RayT
MTDHTHLLLAMPGTIPFSEVVQKIKASSSGSMSEQVRGFHWQEGFGAFSVSASHRDEVIHYIHNQAEHHKKRSFEEEFIALLKAIGVSYDPKYVFG